MNAENIGFVGVHVGAGKYSEKSSLLYEKLCRIACKRSIEVLNAGKSSVEAVTVATAILEDSPLTNAGYGSNLTLDGYVECDASLMNGSDLTFGAVGAVTTVKNPICLAKKICLSQNEEMILGRIPPCVLVGTGADIYAQKCSDIVTVCSESLISPNALRTYKKYKNQLQNVENGINNTRFNRLDTVGAIAVDKCGGTAAACSSGGIILKQPGRIGQAAVYGCGCWAQDRSNSNESSVAVTTSGCGEHIMKTVLAREIANGIRLSSTITGMTLKNKMNEEFLNSRMLQNVDEKLCGVLVLKHSVHNCEFLWAHSTPSFCIAYMDTLRRKATSRLSKLSSPIGCGKSLVVEGISVFSSPN